MRAQSSTDAEKVTTLIRLYQLQRGGRHRPPLGKVGLQRILLKHALRIEIRSVERNRRPHDAPPCIMRPIEEWQDRLLQLFVEGFGLLNLRTAVADRPSGYTLHGPLNPPPHHYAEARQAVVTHLPPPAAPN